MKAVVMAGGEGKRLRPLTCCVPKPLIKIMDKPVLQYIIELLQKYGVDEIAITTRYRADDIDYFVESLDCDNIYTVRESRILGTAGSVKNAAKHFNEPFIVISGDCICDADLSKLMLYHKSIMADMTILCCTVEKPDEYGTVNLKKNGLVDSFCEKPDWSHTSSDLANTGIYVVNPSVLDMIPDDVQYDFAAHLFPEMLMQGKKLYGYQTSAYWSDIGDLKSLRNTIKDIMSFKVDCELPKCKNGIFSSDVVPAGSFSIVPPVYFGKNVTVGNSAVIGPYTVIEDNVSIGENTRIKKSVVGRNTIINSGCDIIGTLVGVKCLVKSNSVCLEGACIGDESTVGSGSTVANNVLVWPAKNIAYRSVMTRNLRDGKNEFELLTCDGICGTTFSEISCERCCRLGEAVAASSFGGKVGIGYDSTKEAKALAMAMLSGLISGGSVISDYGECFMSQVGYYIAFSESDCGIYISADERNAKINLFGAYGLPLSRKYERELESRYNRSDFRYNGGAKCKEIMDMSNLNDIYEGQLLSCVGNNIRGMSATIISSNKKIKMLAEKCLYIAGGKNSAKPEFRIDYYGKTVVAKDEKNCFVPYEKLLMICSEYAIKKGDNIALNFDAPAYLDEFAAENGTEIYRVGKSSMCEFTNEVEISVIKNMWAFDGLALTFKVLAVMNDYGKTLTELTDMTKNVFFAQKVISVDVPHNKLAGILKIPTDNKTQGLRKKGENGVVTICESGAGRLIKIIAEAASVEIAKELCDFTQNKITTDTIDIFHQ